MRLPSLLAAAFVLALALALAPGAAGHRMQQGKLLHEIKHLRWDTNSLRDEQELERLPIDWESGRSGNGYLRDAHGRWQRLFDEALAESYWWELALCESHGNWKLNGAYDGGLQFHPQTWRDYKPKGYPRFAYRATPGEQIRVARKVQADQGWRAWPTCSRKIGLL